MESLCYAITRRIRIFFYPEKFGIFTHLLCTAVSPALRRRVFTPATHLVLILILRPLSAATTCCPNLPASVLKPPADEPYTHRPQISVSQPVDNGVPQIYSLDLPRCS